MEFNESNKYGKLSEEELEAFESANSTKLPGDYRKFLLDFNGGEPSKQLHTETQTVVKYFLGLHNGEFDTSMYKHIDIYSERIPFGMLPIATDPFENLFLLSINEGSHGEIYFWDHEGEPEEQDGTYVDNCYFVAGSFSEFLEGLDDLEIA